MHGGALVFGGGNACQWSARLQADLLGMICYGIDYRMPPNHPYPAALDDCMAVYLHVVDRYGADRVVLGGRSAGGNLAMSTILRARNENLPFPAGAVLLSPELDLTESGDSFQTNRTVDAVLPNSLMSNNLLYADGADLSHPYLSPLFGEMSAGFPPIFLQSGTRDLFLTNAVRLHRKLRRVGSPVEMCSRRCRMEDSLGLRRIWSSRRKSSVLSWSVCRHPFADDRHLASGAGIGGLLRNGPTSNMIAGSPLKCGLAPVVAR
nr:alpha/beta hydrolase [Rhizobium sp. T1473]